MKELNEIELKDCLRIIGDPTHRFTHDQKGIAWDQVIASHRALAARVQAVELENRTYIGERHKLLTKNEALIQQLAEAQGTIKGECWPTLGV